jgi:hypothetical protein
MQPGLPWQRLGDIIPASKATEENELDQYFYRRKRAFTLSTASQKDLSKSLHSPHMQASVSNIECM